jgi:hypothetical protein
MPSAALWRRSLSGVQFAGDGAGGHALGDAIRDNQRKSLSALYSGCSIGRRKVLNAVPSKLCAASLGGLKGSFGAGRNHFPLMLRNGGQYMQGESIRVRIIDCYGCKFARNNDPLRGDFASNSNPS